MTRSLSRRHFLAAATALPLTLQLRHVFGEEPSVKPFSIHVDDAVLVDLRERLARTRWPDQIPGSGWTYGIDLAYMRDLVEYWRTKYDWRACERRLNSFPQFTTEIDGLSLHFIHQRSPHAGAMPLVLSHGWPGSIVEFQKVIGPLTEPDKHGGKAEDAFHVVCPSLPGFGFSGKPREAGWNIPRMAQAISQLMARLGYTRYGAQGGDWGSSITQWLGGNDPAVVGIHITLLTTGAPSADSTDAERQRSQSRSAELADHRAYLQIQGTRPLTLGYGLADSPAGLAAWIVDKFWAWSDHGGNLENSFTKDDLLDNVTLYWVTDTIASSMRIYYESQHTGGSRGRATRRNVPLGVAVFPKEISLPSRTSAERQFNVKHWTEMPKGGHFAAMEQPQMLVEDIRSFFRPLRK